MMLRRRGHSCSLSALQLASALMAQTTVGGTLYGPLLILKGRRYLPQGEALRAAGERERERERDREGGGAHCAALYGLPRGNLVGVHLCQNGEQA